MKTKFIVFAMFFFCCLAAPIQAESYFLLQQYDEEVFHPYPGYTSLDPQTEGFSEPRFRQRFFLNLELPPFEFDHVLLPLILIRFDVRIRGRSPEKSGHFDPLSIDMGGGLIWGFGNWSFTIFGSSEHFFNIKNDPGGGYNYAELRYDIPFSRSTTK